MAKVVEEEARACATTVSKRYVLVELRMLSGGAKTSRARGLTEKADELEDKMEFWERVKVIQGELDSSLIPPDAV